MHFLYGRRLHEAAVPAGAGCIRAVLPIRHICLRINNNISTYCLSSHKERKFKKLPVGRVCPVLYAEKPLPLREAACGIPVSACVFPLRSTCGKRLAVRLSISPCFAYFNPFPPCGERRTRPMQPQQQKSFQSMFPVRGTASAVTPGLRSFRISIHVPRVGNDEHVRCSRNSRNHFNPRSLCGNGRPHALRSFPPHSSGGPSHRNQPVCQRALIFSICAAVRCTFPLTMVR